MRIINDFKYSWNKFFRAWELTVWDYCIFMEDPDNFLDKILMEFNKKKPVLTKEEMKKFLDIIFNKKDEWLESLFWKSKDNDWDKDFHIAIWFFMRKPFSQQYSEIMKMPMKLFLKLQDDVEIITGQKEYDKDRNSATRDKKALKELFWDKKEITNNLN